LLWGECFGTSSWQGGFIIIENRNIYNLCSCQHPKISKTRILYDWGQAFFVTRFCEVK
jgi:hypothetical protein